MKKAKKGLQVKTQIRAGNCWNCMIYGGSACDDCHMPDDI